MNKTKIIATIGPSSCSTNILKELIIGGMDTARFNLSYASYEFCTSVVETIRMIDKELNTHTAIMLDTNGPDLKVGRLKDETFLAKNTKIRIYEEDILGDRTKFSINIKNIVSLINYHDELVMRDGKIRLKVIDKEHDYLICEVLEEGYITENTGIYIPNKDFKIPYISTKDKDDVLFASKINADFLALSFVRTSEDILAINDLLIENSNDHIQLLAKVETKEAVDDIDEIIKVSDGIIVARGDLGIEIPIERIPGIQKSIIKKCQINGKISIVATEFLSTMEVESRPTRAEVSDIANAVIDSVDAVMLSGETTVGRYPVEALLTMKKILSSAEEDINYNELLDRAARSENEDVTGNIVYSVTDCCNKLKAKAIITPTISGYTAKKMSRFRPSSIIIAPSSKEETIYSLSLHFGVRAVLIKELNSFDKILEVSKKMTNDLLNINKGDKIIVTGGYPFKEVKHTNFMKIEEF